MDPNADLTDSEIRLGKGEQVKVSADIPSLISFIRKYLRFCQRKINIFHTKIFKVLSKKENQDEQVILRDLYQDKEFLRCSFCSEHMVKT